jgi:hypothetical protein
VRVTILHIEEKAGRIFKRTVHTVVCSVVFTELELQVIEQRGLENDVLMERIPTTAKKDDDPNKYVLTVGSLLNGEDRFPCRTPLSAKQYEEELTEKLESLRGYIDGNIDTGESKVFEI